jgi:hypothetical protein
MAANPRSYVAAGYFLSRDAGERDATGTTLRRITLAHDHTPRRFFPGAWALSWCSAPRAERLERAAAFGIAARELDDVVAWADRSFGSAFGAWDVFFKLEGARDAARTFLRQARDVELWGVGLHQSLARGFCSASAPPPPAAGTAPTGPSGLHAAACLHPAPLADGGTPLGHELLVPEIGATFNSPESLHLDERAVLQAAGVAPNGHGLVDSLNDALACCRLLDALAPEAQRGPTGWLPWLIVRYSL